MYLNLSRLSAGTRLLQRGGSGRWIPRQAGKYRDKDMNRFHKISACSAHWCHSVTGRIVVDLAVNRLTFWPR